MVEKSHCSLLGDSMAPNVNTDHIVLNKCDSRGRKNALSAGGVDQIHHFAAGPALQRAHAPLRVPAASPPLAPAAPRGPAAAPPRTPAVAPPRTPAVAPPRTPA